jgi:hypothetical protein
MPLKGQAHNRRMLRGFKNNPEPWVYRGMVSVRLPEVFELMLKESHVILDGDTYRFDATVTRDDGQTLVSSSTQFFILCDSEVICILDSQNEPLWVNQRSI